MHRSKILHIVPILLLIIVSACKRDQYTYQQPEHKESVEGMIFLTFIIKDDSTLQKRITLTGKTIVPEVIKSEPENSTSENRVIVSQLDDKLRKLSFLALDHPLFRRVEVTNDQNQFQSKTLKLNNAEFFARVTLLSKTEYIRVEEELAGKIVFENTFKIRD